MILSGKHAIFYRMPPILNLSMSATRFTDGVSAQNQSIMEWVEKRLKLCESGL